MEKIQLPISMGIEIREQINNYREKNGIEEPEEVKKIYNKNETFLKEELKYVKKLTVNAQVGLKYLKYFNDLQGIYFENIKGLEQEHLDIIANSSPNLKELVIKDIDGLHSIDVSKFKELTSLSIISNDMLLRIVGIASINNLISCEIFDNTSLRNNEEICRNMIKHIYVDGSKELNLDVRMFPKMKKEIKEYNKKIEDGKMQEKPITEDMQERVFLWSEIINRQNNYTRRVDKEEQKCTYRHYTMRIIDQKANNILSSLIEKGDSKEQIFTILYNYLKENVAYDHVGKNKDDRMEFHTGKANTNGIADGFLNGKCVCEGYVRMFQYLLDKCGIESEEVCCLTCREDIENGKKNSDHSMIKTYLPSGTYLSDVTFDATNFRKNRYSYQYYLLSKDEMSKTRSAQGRDWDVNETPLTMEEKSKLQEFAEKRIKSRDKKNPEILKSATQATETSTRTGEINNQVDIIKSHQREMTQNIETERNN